jgi:Fur family ferric uptake transcriptional regulator
LKILGRHRHPLSTREIFASLPRGDCDLATVYRSMHLLEGMGMVKRFDLGDGVGRFELLREGDDGHHHHLVCTRCAEVVEIEECFTGEFQDRIAARSGFKSVTHKLEFFGICPACQ